MLKKSGTLKKNYQLKTKSKLLNKSVALKKYPKIKTQEEKLKNQKELEKMWNMFKEIYEERKSPDGKVYSQLSGIFIPDSEHSYNFDHLCEKSLYPELKFEKANILIVTADEHAAKGGGAQHSNYQYYINKAKKELL